MGIFRPRFLHRPLELLRLVFQGKNDFGLKNHRIASLRLALD
ncbi:hypothetical protein [Spirosoma sp. KNUC1025]